MEMPTMCDCGELFDLNDGRRIKRFDKEIIVCEDCYYDAEQDEDEDDNEE